MTMQQRILDKVEESFKKAEVFYGKTFSRPINIIFKRSGTTGGWCNYSRKELMFQLDLAENNQEEFVSQTVPHEVAHWIEKEVYGYQSNNGRRVIHGKHWKYIMRYVYHLDPDRCHSYDTSVTKTKKHTRYTYRCDAGHTHNLSSTIHNRIIKGRRKYTCKCGQPIYLVMSPTVNTINSRDQEIQKLKEEIKRLQGLHL